MSSAEPAYVTGGVKPRLNAGSPYLSRGMLVELVNSLTTSYWKVLGFGVVNTQTIPACSYAISVASLRYSFVGLPLGHEECGEKYIPGITILPGQVL